jgi:phenylalanyl-tRNA synthetase beta chain
MKFTLSWLKDHLDTEASLAELADRLTALGLEVEGIDEPGKKLAPFLIARVIEARRHPDADRLSVCTVDTGAGVVEVVCGAANAKSGMIGVFAPVGSYIPGTDITLEARRVRGVLSNGMLLSEQELELSQDAAGIIELAGEYGRHVGRRYADVMGLADPVFDVKLTPNRPDCTGVRGIARDLAAAGLGKLKGERPLRGVEGDFDCPIAILLEFPKEARTACPCFAGRYLRGVSNGPAPAWMQQRLKAVGARPINALVDVTNYISLDRGRPLHVYDADKLVGAIRARLGRGESFRGLDGRSYQADETMCVIADDRAVLGLGGVLGGEASGCTPSTRNVLIECAYFDPQRTAATARKAGIRSDASYRFERGVDPAFILPGLDLATAMMMEAAGGTPSKARVAGAPPLLKTTIDFAAGRVHKLAGIALSEEAISAALEALGFTLEARAGGWRVTAPSWRPDIHGAADLVEEVVRLIGLDKVPSVPLPRAHGVARPVLSEIQRRVRRARRALAARGFTEAVTWSFIPTATAQAFGGGEEALQLANPISSEMTCMRPSLLPGLLAALARNRNRGFADVALFEVGHGYRNDEPGGQFTAASGVRAGASQLTGSGRHWSGAAATADAFDAKADLVALLAELGVDAAKAQVTRDAPAFFHPGRSASLRMGRSVLAHYGEMHPELLSKLGLDPPVAAFELFLEALPRERKSRRGALKAADLLPVRRDFAFLLDRKVPAAEVVRAALGANKALIANVNVFDVFEGGNLGAGKKSLALEVTLQPLKKTLTEAEIDELSARIIAAVGKATGGEIRK